MTVHNLEFALPPMHLPCGGTAYFDESSGISYRCEHCMAVVGSVGMPRSCRQEIDKYEVLKQLGGRVSWDYNKGCEVPATVSRSMQP